jgi:hypothetical protein
MADDLAPFPPEPRLRGNSAAYLRSRLERDGYIELLAAVDRGELSTFAAGVEAGYTKRPEPLGTGSQNARRRRDWTIAKAYRVSARADAAPGQEAPRNGRSAPTPPIDLAAALAEWEQAQKPPVCDREPEPEVRVQLSLNPPEPERTPFPAHPAIPCTNCERPEAAAALREILNVYVAATRGEPHVTGSTLPRACCQRQLRHPDVRAMIA